MSLNGPRVSSGEVDGRIRLVQANDDPALELVIYMPVESDDLER